MSITAIVVNDTIKLPVHVPDGTRVEVAVPPIEHSGGEIEQIKNWLVSSAGIAKGKLTTADRMRETRGED